MKKEEILKLDEAVGLFNYEDAKTELVLKMMKNKSALAKIAGEVRKQLKDLSESLKPADLDLLDKDLKTALAEPTLDQSRIKTIQLRRDLLQQEWNKKYSDSEPGILAENINITLQKITSEEFDILRKPKKQLADMSDNRRELIVVNHFSSSSLSAIEPLIKF